MPGNPLWCSSNRDGLFFNQDAFYAVVVLTSLVVHHCMLPAAHRPSMAFILRDSCCLDLQLLFHAAEQCVGLRSSWSVLRSSGSGNWRLRLVAGQQLNPLFHFDRHAEHSAAYVL